jgi:hypothetical protein
MASDSVSVPAAVRTLSERLAQLRPMRRGSLSERYMKCSKTGCACQRDEQARHGPYYSLTRNIGGQTQSRLIPADQVERIREQIAAGKQFRQQVEAVWAACEQWAEAETAAPSTAREVEKRGSRRRSRRRSRPKSKR